MLNVFSIFDMLVKDDVLHAVLHQPLRMHIHCVAYRVKGQVLLHLCYVYNFPSGQFLKLGVVNVRPVKCYDVTTGIVRWAEHETVVGGCRGEADVRRHAFVCMDVGMNLDATLLLAGLGMSPCTFEYEVREQSDGSGIYDLQTFEPLRNLFASVVR